MPDDKPKSRQVLACVDSYYGTIRFVRDPHPCADHYGYICEKRVKDSLGGYGWVNLERWNNSDSGCEADGAMLLRLLWAVLDEHGEGDA